MVAMGRLSQAVLSHFAGAVITPPFAAWKARHLSPAIGPARFRGQARVPFTLHTLQGGVIAPAFGAARTVTIETAQGPARLRGQARRRKLRA